jgi:hypothetical protein
MRTDPLTKLFKELEDSLKAGDSEDPCASCDDKDKCSGEKKEAFRKVWASLHPVDMIVIDMILGPPPQDNESDDECSEEEVTLEDE